MKVFKSLLIIVVLATCAVFAVLYFADPDVEVRDFKSRFERVSVGDPESKVVAMLGPPDSRENSFRLGQVKGYEDAYARARSSGATNYMIWFKGVSVVFTIGVDEKGLVRVKEQGGT